MLSIFLCTGRSAHLDDLAHYTIDPPNAPRKKLSLNAGSGTKRKVSKIQIGAPSDFKHYTHMGYDEVAGLDVNQYEHEFQMRMAQTAPAATTLPMHTKSHSNPPVSPPRRKPAPSADSAELHGIISASPPVGAGIGIGESPSRSHSSSTSTPQKKLVPLLNTSPQGSPNQRYVTATAKMRFDDALGEIERALRTESR